MLLIPRILSSLQVTLLPLCIAIGELCPTKGVGGLNDVQKYVFLCVAGPPTPFVGQSPVGASSRIGREDGEVRRFVAENRVSKNQLVFSLETRTEKVTGLSNEPKWVMSFDPADVAGTLRGEMTVSVKSLDTGKREHNEKLQSPDWLDAAKHPEIRFELRSVKDAKSIAPADWNLICKGVATVRAKEYPVELKFRLTYLEESAETRERAPGHLVVLRGSFELPQNVFGSAGDADRTITLDLRLFGSTESTTGKPGPPDKSRRSPSVPSDKPAEVTRTPDSSPTS